MIEDLHTKGQVQNCKLTKVSIQLVVPRDGIHEFWSRGDLRKTDGKYENGIPIEITAFGSSTQEARENAMFRLNSFLGECRKLIRPSSPSHGRSQSQFDPKADPALRLAGKLFESYRIHLEAPDEDDRWTNISKILEDEERNTDLRPLIEYYMVRSSHPLFPSFYPSCSVSNEYQGVGPFTSGEVY
jgi:hypothetical protein